MSIEFALSEYILGRGDKCLHEIPRSMEQDCDEQIAQKYQDAEAGSRNVEILQPIEHAIAIANWQAVRSVTMSNISY